MNDYQKAYLNDDFDEFEKLVMKNRFRSVNQIKTDLTSSEQGLSFFETILSSNEKHAPRYISYFMRNFELWNDEKFLSELNHEGRSLTFYAAQSTNAGNLISYLMFDWYSPDLSSDRMYFLSLKSRQFLKDTNRTLLEKLYEIIDDDSARVFQDVCLRVIYQYFIEINGYCSHIEEVLSIKNIEYREKILQIFLVFYEHKKQLLSLTSSEENVTYIQLACLLIEKCNAKFEKEFDRYIEESIRTHGDYFEVDFKHRIRYLARIAENEGMNRISEIIFNRCPHVEHNLPLMAIFYDVQDFRTFNIYPFKDKELAELVKY